MTHRAKAKASVSKSPKRSMAAPATTPPPTARRARRTDTALQPATALEVLVSRALDQELEWLFAYAESGLCRQSVGILPPYAAVRILATEPTDEACRVAPRARASRPRLPAKTPPPPGERLRAAYTPRRWPRVVENAFDVLAPIAVRLAFAQDPWPARFRAHRARGSGSAAVVHGAPRPGQGPGREDESARQALLGDAIAAYATARSEEGCS